MFEIQMYEVAIRHGDSDLMLRVSRDDLDAVLRSLTSSGVEAFHVRRIPMMHELAQQVAGVVGSSGSEKKQS